MNLLFYLQRFFTRYLSLQFYCLPNQNSKSMQHSRILKEIRHIKGSQIKDNQSVLSHSRSSASYQFNHTKFGKPIEPKHAQTKTPFHLQSVLKAKSKHKQHRTELPIKKASRQNSLSSLLDREPISLTLKKKSNQKLEHKMKRFLENVKNIHNQLKEMTKSMLVTFEKIKEEMETNLLNVTDQMMKFSGEVTNVSVIHEIWRSGFEQIRKTVIQPLGSLSQLNGLSQGSLGQHTSAKQQKRRNTSRQPPLTPMIKANNQDRRQTDIIYSSAFSTQLISPQREFKLERLNLNSVSKNKARAQTQRRKGESGGDIRKQSQQMAENKIIDGRELMTGRSTESTHNIDCIIGQMREILNE